MFSRIYQCIAVDIGYPTYHVEIITCNIVYLLNCSKWVMENEEEHLRDELECDTTHKVKKRTILAFGVIGFLVDFFFAISLSAAQDILEATKIPTSVVLLAASGPACLTTAVYPYFFQRISVSVTSCIIFTLSVTGMLITSLVDDPVNKVIGVCLVSFGIGGTETVFYPLTSFYGGSTINSYAFGSGLSFLTAPLSYIGKTLLTQILKVV